MSEPILFSEDMLEHLRRTWAPVPDIDPQSHVLADLHDFFVRLDRPRLKQLSEAGIKWISPLALTRLNRVVRPL